MSNGRQQPGSHNARLAAPARPDDGDESAARPRLPEAGEQSFDEPFPAVEVDGVDGIERPQPLERVGDLAVIVVDRGASGIGVAAEGLVQIADEGLDSFVADGGVGIGGTVDHRQHRGWQCLTHPVDLTVDAAECAGGDDRKAVDVG